MDNQIKLLSKGTFGWDDLHPEGLDETKSVLLCALGKLIDEGKYPPYTLKQIESSCADFGYNPPSSFQIDQDLKFLAKSGYIGEDYSKVKGSKGLSKKVYRGTQE